jgi:cell shape-determining protein MreC
MRPRTRSRKLLIATILVLVIFGIDLITGGIVRSTVRSLGAGVSSLGRSATNTIFGGGFFSSRASLSAENRALGEQLAQYQERAAAFDALRSENDQLRELSHLAAQRSGLTAPVVSSVISSPYGTFLIGAGSQDGIARGSIVLTSGGFAIGQVSDVGAHVSTVTEIFAPDASVSAIIAGSPAALTGSGGGNAHASLPREALVQVGSAVYSPQFGERPVGVVGEIASSSASASQDIYIRLPINIGALQYVYVVSS